MNHDQWLSSLPSIPTLVISYLPTVIFGVSCLIAFSILYYFKFRDEPAENSTESEILNLLHELEEELGTGIIVVIDKFWDIRKRMLSEELRQYIVSINDDMTFTSLVSKSEGDLNVILDTLGGSISSNDHMIKVLMKYNRSHGNVITNIPYQAFSAGTMLALTGTQIRMGSCATMSPIDPQLTFEAPHVNQMEFSTRVIMDGGKHMPRDKMDPLISMLMEEASCYHDDSIDNMKVIMEQLEYDEETINCVEEVMCSGLQPHSKTFDFEDLEEIGLKVTEDIPEKMMDLIDLIHKFRMEWIASEPKSDDEEYEEC